jgi:hypothetical protein
VFIDAARATIQALYLFAPLLVASALSGVVLRLDLFPKLKRPVDGGHTFRGCRVFGDSKTWRGFIVAAVPCTATVLVQRFAVAPPEWLLVVDYDAVNSFAFGITMGTAAMVGELPNSFVKRQLGIAPGGTARGTLAAVFWLWDQVDLLTTVWPALWLWVRPRPLLVVMSFVLALALHPTISLVGYLIGARRSIR